MLHEPSSFGTEPDNDPARPADAGVVRNVLAAGAGALALGLSTSPARAARLSLGAGAGKAAIAVPVPIGGFATIVDPLFVRVLVFDDSGTRGALVSIDLTSLDGTLITGWASIVAQAIGANVADVVIYAAHNFSSPHAWDPNNAPPGTDLAANAVFVSAINTAVQQAAEAALSGLRPTRIGHGTGRSRLAVNRNELSSQGWWVGFDDTAFSDPLFSALRFDDDSDTPIALLVNVAVQPSVLDSVPDANGLPVISADLAGAVATRLESYYGGGVTAFFLPGAAGDQSPVFKGVFNIFPPGGEIVTISSTQDVGVGLLDQLAGRMTADVVRVLDAVTVRQPTTLLLHQLAVPVLSVTNGSHNDTAPVLTHTYDIGPATTIPCTILAINDVVLVGTSPELSAILGVEIRKLSPFRTTMVSTMVGAAFKYLPDQQGYDRFTYEAIEAQVAPGSGEVFVAAVGQYLQTLTVAR